jgi:hypothetical protein
MNFPGKIGFFDADPLQKTEDPASKSEKNSVGI